MGGAIQMTKYGQIRAESRLFHVPSSRHFAFPSCRKSRLLVMTIITNVMTKAAFTLTTGKSTQLLHCLLASLDNAQNQFRAISMDFKSR